MDYDPTDPENMRAARELLDRLLTETTDKGHRIVPSSAIMHNALSWYTIDRVDGVHVYQGGKGGWFADLTFMGIPAGVPGRIGTPVGAPLPSRAAAIEAAAALVQTVKANRQSPDAGGGRVFEIAGLTVVVPRELVEVIAYHAPPGDGFIEKRLEEVMQKYAPAGLFTEDGLQGLNEESRRELQVVCCMALSVGMVRWPIPHEEPPPSMH